MRFKYYFLGFVAVMLFNSCGGGEDEEITPPNPTSADILGSVNLYDEGTTQIDNSNMTVRAEGTSKSATTDADGDFVLSDVTFGVYTLIYEKSGYGTFKRFNLQHANGSTIISENPSLGEVSTTQVTGLEASVSGNDIMLSVTTDPGGSNGNTRYIRYFLSADSDVSDMNYTYHSPGLIAQINPLELAITSDDLTNAGFSSGETVYVKVYGESFWSNEYEDPDLGRKVFPNLNMNSVDAVSFVIP